MTTENKPREFWIWGFKIGPDESISQNCSVHLDKGGSEWYDPVHHVIEYAAVEQLKAQNEKLRTKLADWQNGAELNELYIRQYEEIQQLKSNLKIAVEALRGLNNEVAAMIATHGDVISQDYGRTNLECLEHRLGIAREALSKIGEG